MRADWMEESVADLALIIEEQANSEENPKKNWIFFVDPGIMDSSSRQTEGITALLKRKESEADKHALDRLAGEKNYWKFAIVSRIKTHKDKNDESMAFLQITGTDGIKSDVTVFARDWKKVQIEMEEGSGGIFFLKPGARGSTVTKYIRIGE